MKSKELRNLSKKELQEKISESQKQYLEMDYEHRCSKLQNPNKIKEMRRQIARMQTILQEKDREEVIGTIKEGKLNRYNLRTFLQNNHIDMNINRAKLKKLIVLYS